MILSDLCSKLFIVQHKALKIIYNSQLWLSLYVYVHTHKHTYTHICIYVYIYIMCLCICVCVCACVFSKGLIDVTFFFFFFLYVFAGFSGHDIQFTIINVNLLNSCKYVWRDYKFVCKSCSPVVSPLKQHSFLLHTTAYTRTCSTDSSLSEIHEKNTDAHKRTHLVQYISLPALYVIEKHHKRSGPH